MTTPQPPQPLAEVVTLLEHSETARRRGDAGRLRLMAGALAHVVGDGDGAGASSSTARDLAYRSLRAELATAFRLSEHAVERQLDLAYRLTEQYVATLDALEAGEVALQHAQVIADAGVIIGAGDTPEIIERRGLYERAVLEVAVEETPNRLKPIARRLAERWTDCPLEERTRAAVSGRRVTVVEAEDGMADLLAHLPALEAYAIKDRLTRAARCVSRVDAAELRDAAAENSETHVDAQPRTLDQLRADVFTEVLLESDLNEMTASSSAEAIRARVQIIVPVDALPRAGAAGTASSPNATGTPVELAGYGPISAGSAHDTIGEATHWETVSVERGTGDVLAVDRYRPSEEMRRLITARDRHCRFPGCRVPAHRCDIDHTIDAAHGGPTSTDNLATLCRGHHTLKHHTGWTVEQASHGVLRWRSPTGRHHTDRPPGMLEPPGTHDTTRVAESTGPPGGRRSSVRFEPS